jgi:hypothetical protein
MKENQGSDTIFVQPVVVDQIMLVQQLLALSSGNTDFNQDQNFDPRWCNRF